MDTCVHLKITDYSAPIFRTSDEISPGTCEIFTSLGMLAIEYQRSHFHNMK
jgi:hypothetical protein